MSKVMTGKNIKQIKTPLGVFDSVELAAQAENRAPCTISNKVRTKPDQYYFL